jgi:hypothetical protein
MRTPKPISRLSVIFVIYLVAIALLALSVPAQVKRDSKIDEQSSIADNSTPSLAPTPIFFPGNGNVTCADLNSSTNPLLSHMTENWEWKFDPPSGGGPFPMTSGLNGGLPANPNLFMTYSVGPATTMNSWQLSWSTPAALNRMVSAVIVKGGNVGTNVYPYPTLSAGDTGPFTLPSGTQAISHLAFCFEPFTGPSAAPGSISGRVMTAAGRPISGATILIQNLSNGGSTYVTTNTFGYYGFKNLTLTDFYVMSVSHRRYTFEDSVRTFTLNADLVGMDFVSAP